jgi:hypothetical protein
VGRSVHDEMMEMASPATEQELEVSSITVTDMEDAKRCRNLPCLKRIHINPAFFGTPGCAHSPTWPQRTYFMMSIGEKMSNIEEVILEGTLLGQVVPAETLAEAIGTNLRVLKANAGVIFDDQHAVSRLAQKLRKNQQLEIFELNNFENHLTTDHHHYDDNNHYLFDPIMSALTQIKTLRRVHLSCLASYIPWKSSYISDQALRDLLVGLPHLQSLALSNLGLTDGQFEIIAKSVQQHSHLKELILNLNYDSIDGLQSIVDLIGTSSGQELKRVEVMNDVHLSGDMYRSILRSLEQNKTLFEFKFAVEEDAMHEYCPGSIESFLLLNRLGLREEFVHQDTSQQRCIEILDQVTSDVNCVYFLLRERPHLCNIKGENVAEEPLSCTRSRKSSLKQSSAVDNQTNTSTEVVECCCALFIFRRR